MRPKRTVARITTLLVLGMMLATVAAHADALFIDFESYSTGTINGQDGWSSLGAAGSGCATYDHEVVDNTGATYSYPSFGSKSLRISNAVTSGCFGDQTFSKSLGNEAGETSAMSDGLSGGTRQSRFEAEWDFASTVPTAEQSGLSTVASPDRGDGARMSWVQMVDTATGIDINFNDFQVKSSDIDGSCTHGDFVQTTIATALNRTKSHHIKIVMNFFDGPGNDVVKVFVDGDLKHTGTSWEDYFRECEGNPTRTVDSILFRTGGANAPATAGKGWLIDNLKLLSTGIGTKLTATPAIAELLPNVKLYLFRLHATLTADGTPLAGKTINFTVGQTAICSAKTNASGTASCSGTGSALNIILGVGYKASFAGGGGFGPASVHAQLLIVNGVSLP